MPQATPSAVRSLGRGPIRYSVSRPIQIDLQVHQRLAIKPRTERSLRGRPPVGRSETCQAKVAPASRNRPHLPRKNGHQDHVSRQLEDTGDIIIDDLRATIEAHRSTNTASIMRKIASDTPLSSGFERINVLSSGTGDAVEGRHQSGVPVDQKPSDIENIKVKKTSDLGILGKKDAAIYKKTRVSKSRSTQHRVQDYEGKIRGPTDRWAVKYIRNSDLKHSDRPWLAYLQSCDVDGPSRLSNEIRAFEAYMRPTLTEESAVQYAIESVQRIVSSALPLNPISIFGSRYTGLAGPLSDVDFSLSLPEFKNDLSIRGPSATRPKARRAGMKVLSSLVSILHSSGQFSNISIIPAHIPILTATDHATGVTFQFQTLAPILPSREWTSYYLSEFPGLRPLFLLLRHSLKIRDLTTVHNGGLGSYPLVIMIVTALKHAHGSLAPDDLAGQLIHILDFYANANLYKHGYSADPPRIFTKTSKPLSAEKLDTNSGDPHLLGIDLIRKGNQKIPWALCLQDPANPVNDLGRKAHQIQHIQATFAKVRQHIWAKVQMWDQMKTEARQRWVQGLLDPLVRARYDDFEASRHILSKAGESGPRNETAA